MLVHGAVVAGYPPVGARWRSIHRHADETSQFHTVTARAR